MIRRRVAGLVWLVALLGLLVSNSSAYAQAQYPPNTTTTSTTIGGGGGGGGGGIPGGGTGVTTTILVTTTTAVTTTVPVTTTTVVGATTTTTTTGQFAAGVGQPAVPSRGLLSLTGTNLILPLLVVGTGLILLGIELNLAVRRRRAWFSRS